MIDTATYGPRITAIHIDSSNVNSRAGEEVEIKVKNEQENTAELHIDDDDQVVIEPKEKQDSTLAILPKRTPQSMSRPLTTNLAG